MKSLFLVLFSISLLFAQPNIDSFYSVISKQPQPEQITKLANACWEYRSITPHLALQFGKESLQKIEATHNYKLKSTVLNYLGVIYGNLGKLDSAFFYYKEALNVATTNNDETQIAYSLNNLGDYYIKSALYSTGLEKIMHAYDIFERLQNKQGMAYSLNDIGEIFLIQQDFTKALEYFKRSCDIRLELKDKRGYAKSLINLANTYDNLKQIDKALETFSVALQASKEADYIKGQGWVYTGLADLYLRQGKYELALQNSEKALALDLKIENKYGEIINYNRLAQIYIKLKDHTKARYYLGKAKTESELSGHIDQLMIAYRHFTDISQAEGNYNEAFNFFREYETLNERIFSQQSLNRIADLQLAFVLEKKDRENEMLKRDLAYQKNTRNYLILISLLIFGLGILVVSKYKAGRKTNLLLQELNNAKDSFFSIIAHDLKGPIGAVANLAEILHSDYEDLPDTDRKRLITSVSETSIEVRRLLLDLLTWANTQKGGMGLNPSSLNLKALLDSSARSNMLMAKNKNLKLILEVEDNFLITADKFILETIAGNFINNAIKFSFPDNKIVIAANMDEKMVHVSVTDFGKGMNTEILDKLMKIDTKVTTIGTKGEKGTGLGLKICKEFAALHNGKIEIVTSPDKGSKFTFSFPYIAG
ncbi:MAG: tetratricopeptide repeat-containing sensor histidine kinase [Ignavibacteria bacterium]|nr:tetratricopeptide repeat-containing sensor histidine kinase [Ignavibacteria bacterium]